MGACTLPVRHPLRGGYIRGLKYTFQARERYHGRFNSPRKKTRAGGQEEGAGRDPALTTSLGGMIYAYDAGVISQSPEKLRRVMGVIVVVGVAFGLTVSEAKTEIMCLRTKGVPHTTTIFSVEAAGQVNNQKQEFLYLEGGRQP